MRIGLLAQDINSGIGHQTWEFARAMNPAKVLITDLNEIHRRHGKHVESHPERYQDYDTRRTSGFPSAEDIDWILTDIDMVFVVETPLEYGIFSEARKRGIKTFLQYNYEFLDYFYRQYRDAPRPDVFLAPTSWGIDEVRELGRVIEIPVPVAIDRFQFEQKTKANRFLHIAGHKTYKDRNGTQTVKEAWQEMTEPPELILFSQEDGDEVKEYWNLYDQGDVLVLPRRYGGLSLQIQEAWAKGLVIIVGKHDPYASECLTVNSSPGDPLALRKNIQTYDVEPKSLAKEVMRLAGMDISHLSKKSRNRAEKISWERLRGEYNKTFEDILNEKNPKGTV